MAHSILTSKGQITIPKTVRNKLNLKTGDKIIFTVRNGEVTLKPASKTVKEVFGLLSGKQDKSYTLEQINEKLTKAISDKNK
ncbi:MAG TPA: AbrB/MazE/SpoVT family DNA-binding domain-containing protein [Spirochaetota bacterium]|nr:AbrB/MazE/SpoVT family DNA-binding domain-containing protein [Spirochaetota bacterium]HPI90171.1 AbrB/MazE/SpoVT family DNA-binding domain-containing protein [Spirochaetota bacterium]HPR49610.1 AbrB/MazE/SpoVT family DNA-binding domain-containing protein [Spirochaetota bacterium]